MNRRKTIKSILGIGFLSVSAFSIFKWEWLSRTPDIQFLVSQKKLIAELAEMIIPTTDTPGAKDAQVEDYIITMILDCSPKKKQNIFIDGLVKLKSYCLETYKKSFEDCDLEEKTKILRYFQGESLRRSALVTKIERKLIGQPFFSQLKELTIIGYCTSNVGATGGLAYDFIPGTYISCTQLTPDQKSWATK
jgi:hypothetical protein